MVRMLPGSLILALSILLATTAPQAGVIRHDVSVDQSEVVLSQDKSGLISVSMDRAVMTNYLGFPELPYRVLSILIPQGEQVVSVRLEGVKTVELPLSAELAPFEGQYLDDGTTRGISAETSEILKGDSVFPAWKVRHLGTRSYRGYSIASIAVYPVSFDTGTGRLTLDTSLELVVETAAGPSPADFVERKRYVEGFRERSRAEVESMVVNPSEASSYTFNEMIIENGDRGFVPSYLPSMEGSEVNYLIITSAEMQPAFEVFAEWKTKKGVPAVVRTVEWITENCRHGADFGETIRNFITEAYAKWGVEYVLLAGDTEIIPARYGYVSFYTGDFLPTDMYYSCLDGNWNADGDSIWGEAYHSSYEPGDEVDLYSEVYIGRMPVSTLSEANILINKSMNYELPLDFESKKKFVLLGEVIFPTIWAPGQTVILDGAEILEDVYLPHLSADPDIHPVRLYQTDYDYPGSYHLSKTAAIDTMNTGANHVAHAGHGYKYNMSVGEGSILNYDAYNLTNGDKTFSMYLMNCTNVAYDTDCLAEYFLMNANGGAFAVTGSSRSAFPSSSRPYLDNYYYLLFDEDVVQLGKLYTKSREPFTPGAAAETADRWTHFIYNYLGDPELCMYRGRVDTFEVSYPAAADFGPNDITITVTSGGMPFDSAYVCLYKTEDDYVYGYTDISGEITFDDFLCRDNGYIDLTVTGLDHARFHDTLSVNPENSVFLRVDKVKIGDYLIGNNDQVLDSGETAALSVKLANTGQTAGDKIYAILRSSDPNVVITDSTSIYPPIGVDEITYALDPFNFSVGSSVPDEQSIEFTLDVHDSTGGFWTEKIAIEVHAPELEIYVNTVSDEVPYGDGDGIIETGERFILNVGIKNFGTGTANGLGGVVRTSSGAITIIDSTSTYANLGLLDVGFGSGFVMEEVSILNPNLFDFELTDSYGRKFTKRMELRKPSPPDTIYLDASYGATEIHATWHAPDDLEDYRFLVFHSMIPGGPYDQASDDLIFHSLYRDRGLNPSTRYYYVIVAVDSCGNMSDYSVEETTTTSPPQLEGWPNSIAKESSSSPKVADIDGDTHVDVVIGSDYIHAWHGDGVEIRDGDGQPLTWGIFNQEGTTFTATVALGPLDDQPGHEIVGAAWDTKKIYVFNADGGNLPGFPKTTVDLCWASPVLGDLDGDGDLEIIAYDVDGTIYVWHHDGTELMDGDSNPATDGPFFSAGLASHGWHVSTPALADMDDDGIVELIVCAPADYIYCLNGDGSAVAGWPLLIDGGANISASPAVGDIDGDGYPEVVVQTSYARVYGINHDGTEMAGWPKWVTSNTFFPGSPALADLTGNGKLEVLVPGMNGYLYIFTSTGSNLPGWPIQYSTTGGTESSPTVADISGDGSMDIILGAENGLLNAWDITGATLPGFPIQLNGFVRGTPTVDDMDQDGDVELIACCWDQNVYIWDIDAELYYDYRGWNGFHGNILNNGWVEHPNLTGAENIACAFSLNAGQVILNWTVIAGIDSWDLLRSSGDGQFELLAKDLTPDQAGMLIYSDPVVEEGLVYNYRLEASSDRDIYAEANGIEIPVRTARLYQNYPNPFNPTTRMAYTVPGSSSSAKNVLLTVYDVRGALVKTLVNEPVSGGRHIVTWDGTNNRGEPVSSGVYFSRLATGGTKEVKKMLLLR